MTIYELQGHEVRLGIAHEDEVKELKWSIEEERERMRQRENRNKNNLYQKITDIAVKNTPNQVPDGLLNLTQ